jgi:WD40 repeat protein
MFFKPENNRTKLTNGAILAASLSNDKQKHLVATLSDEIYYFDSNLNVKLNSFLHKGFISDLLFLDEIKFVSAGSDGFMKIWDIEGGLLHEINAHANGVTSLLKREHSFLTAGYDSLIKEWNFEGDLIHVYPQRHLDSIFSLTMINESQFASVSANKDHRILIWDADSKEMITEIDISEAKGAYKLVALNQNTLATAGAGVCLWSTLTGECLHKNLADFYHSGISAFAKISDELLAVGADSIIYLVNPRDLSVVKKIPVIQGGPVYKILPNGENSFFSYGEDGNLRSFKEGEEHLLTNMNNDKKQQLG